MYRSESATRARRRQHGLSLVGLLAGTAIALLVAIAAFHGLRIFHRLAAEAAELSRLQRQGDFALHLIGQHLRQAGAVDPVAKPGSGLHSFARLGQAGAADAAPVRGSDAAAGRPGTLTVSFVPARGASAASGPATLPQYDCSGAVIGGTEPIQTRFDVAPGGSLMCNARNRQPIIEDVADFQLRYRVQTESGLQTLPAAGIEALKLWPAVRAVELCLELASDLHSIATRPASRDQLRCNGEALPARRLHKVFRQLYSLRTMED